MKPIYVTYIAYRNCNNNPSWDRFARLDYEEQARLFDNWDKRHQERMKTDKKYAKMVKGMVTRIRKGIKKDRESNSRVY
jgi:hypothetical protein